MVAYIYLIGSMYIYHYSKAGQVWAQTLSCLVGIIIYNAFYTRCIPSATTESENIFCKEQWHNSTYECYNVCVTDLQYWLGLQHCNIISPD